MRKSCHYRRISPSRHIFNFVFLRFLRRRCLRWHSQGSAVPSVCYQLCTLPKSKSRLISHQVESRPEPGKLGVEFPSSYSSSSSCFACFLLLSRSCCFLGGKIYANERSLCGGNLEQFYHIKQSIVFVLFHLFNFLECRVSCFRGISIWFCFSVDWKCWAHWIMLHH